MTRAIALVDHTERHPPSRGVLEAMAEALTAQIKRDFAPAHVSIWLRG
jgi:hypothetical protein